MPEVQAGSAPRHAGQDGRDLHLQPSCAPDKGSEQQQPKGLAFLSLSPSEGRLLHDYSRQAINI